MSLRNVSISLPTHIEARPLGLRAWACRDSRFLLLDRQRQQRQDRKSTRLNSSHGSISYAVFCLKKKTESHPTRPRVTWAYMVGKRNCSTRSTVSVTQTKSDSCMSMRASCGTNT